MISMLNSLEVLRDDIDCESQEDRCLSTSFNQFKLNVSMSKKDYHWLNW
jgi:hypothetical protein